MEQKARDKVITVVLCNSKNLHLSVGVLLINMCLFFLSLSRRSRKFGLAGIRAIGRN
jgi:hypothetical protein